MTTNSIISLQIKIKYHKLDDLHNAMLCKLEDKIYKMKQNLVCVK